MPLNPREMYRHICVELELCENQPPQDEDELQDCVSDCYILPVPMPRIAEVPGRGESHSKLLDEYLYLNSDVEQDV